VADLRLKVDERTSLVARLAEDLKGLDAQVAAEKREHAERRQAREKELEQLHQQATECTEKLTIAANMRNNRKNVERALSEAAAQVAKLRTAKNPFEEQKAEKDTRVRSLQQAMEQIKVHSAPNLSLPPALLFR
jgi:chromosome segregation ATPase